MAEEKPTIVLVAALILAGLGIWPHTALAIANVSVLLSLPENIEQRARHQIDSIFSKSNFTVTIYSRAEFQDKPASISESETIIVAAGRESCEYAAENLRHKHVLCVLVSAEVFTQVRLNSLPMASEHRFGAIVIDQPIERQVTIASKVFPALKKFGVLASAQEIVNAEKGQHALLGEYAATDGMESTVQIDYFNQDQALAPQVADALSDQDALVAIPDKNLYTAERLRTVLLTAYGYAKPVIGYNSAYVKAGALISAYTTPNQVFRQTAEILEKFVGEDPSPRVAVFEPRYFSIAENPSIAKSLGLVRRYDYRKNHDYIDKDFAP